MDLVNKKNQTLSSLVEQYLDKDIMIRYDMELCQVGSPEWCMFEFKRFDLVKDCKKELVCFQPVYNTALCRMCDKLLVHDTRSGDMVCSNCGIVVPFINDSNITFHEMSMYNCASIHRYTWYEHFSQSLSDFANIGDRNVPSEIMAYCRVYCGTGNHVSSNLVYEALQSNGYRAHYQYKYEIANTLRGSKEFELSRDEIEQMRSIYIRCTREFMPFQEMYNLNRKSSRGKPRLYWPMRFILARLVEEINRGDLIKFIRPIACANRLKIYKFYWYKLRELVESRTPIKSIYLGQQFQLKKSKHSRH